MLKECIYCGNQFEPDSGYRRMCPECYDVVMKNRGRRCSYMYSGPVNVEAYEYKLRQRNIEAHQDTIVAEGYADRQRAKTLSTISKIKTTL